MNNLDTQDAIAQSVFRNEITHIQCNRQQADQALGQLQCDEGYIGDVEANGTIEVWGDYHCAQGVQEWRVHLDIADDHEAKTTATVITLHITADLIDACEATGESTELYHGYHIAEDATRLLERYEQEMKAVAAAEYGDDVEIQIDCSQIRCSGATRADRIVIDSADHGDQQRAEDWLQEARQQAWQQACG